MDKILELLDRAHEIADWYELKDLMFDENNRPYVIVEDETDFSEDYKFEFRKKFLDY